ncbi:unnamed protein product [Ceutorhynchus assimilis]|uniref:Mitochondrial import inner membrane translocase subunit Tim21 n=1 Tax=Ceutorhynchus assimilis TaxID=467358 RepID=A0A9N9MWM3_9CUCU|nr:unnamed protein product [Ceutorhynchus assimilis]
MIPLRITTNILASRLQIATFSPILFNHLHHRLKSTGTRSEITPSASSKESAIDTNVKPLGERVKETTKTTYNALIILVGLGVIGGLGYTIFSELFSSKSPSNIYKKAVDKCIESTQVSDKLGYPISSHGHETRRGRRQHVTHAFYVDKEGRKHIRMKFHLKGTSHSGTSHVDMVENDKGKYEYRYLFVEVDDMFKSVIIVEDNRNKLGPESNLHDLDMKF